jgi:S-adenosylmethionine decarboxylase
MRTAGELLGMQSSSSMKFPEATPVAQQEGGHLHTEDHFSIRRGVLCAGIHLLIDMRDVQSHLLTDAKSIEAALRNAVSAAGATVVFANFHTFKPHGVTGVLGLSESHISIHTWPELGEAQFDILLCGQTRPYSAALSLYDLFHPREWDVEETLRGRRDGTKMGLLQRSTHQVRKLAASE